MDGRICTRLGEMLNEMSFNLQKPFHGSHSDHPVTSSSCSKYRAAVLGGGRSSESASAFMFTVEAKKLMSFLWCCTLLHALNGLLIATRANPAICDFRTDVQYLGPNDHDDHGIFDSANENGTSR